MEVTRVFLIFLAAAAPAGETEKAPPFFSARGVVLVPGDLSWKEWPERAKAANLTAIALHDGASPRNVVRFIESADGRAFLDRCRALGLDVEYELHAMRELLPRDLFAREPDLFRMDEKGARTADANLCVRSARALDVAAGNALDLARALRPTTHRYFFWGDDGAPWCRCPACARLSEADQALVLENRLVEALRKEDPEARLAHLAYANTLAPPKEVKPRPGIFLEFAPITRKYDVPLDGAAPRNREALQALDANLKVFGAAESQVLEYWLDASLFSGYRRPAVKVPFDPKVFARDLEVYAARGVRRATTFAVYIDADYVRRHGEPPLREYGAGLAAAGPR